MLTAFQKLKQGRKRIVLRYVAATKMSQWNRMSPLVHKSIHTEQEEEQKGIMTVEA